MVSDLLGRFGFPPRAASPRIEKADPLHWTVFYNLKSNIDLKGIKPKDFETAADNDGAQFDQAMRSYFGFRIHLFADDPEQYDLLNPPELFDGIFETQVHEAFPDDDDIRQVTEDFKDVSKRNFFQKVMGKRRLQLIPSLWFVLQPVFALWLLLIAGGAVYAGAYVYQGVVSGSWMGVSWLATSIFLWSVAYLMGRYAVQMPTTKLMRASLLKTHIWYETSQIVPALFLPLLVLAAIAFLSLATAFLPASLILPGIGVSMLPQALVAASLAAVLAMTVLGVLSARYAHHTQRNIVEPIKDMNQQIHEKYKDVTRQTTQAFVNYIQKRLNDLQTVFKTLENKIDQDENLHARTWPQRAKIWTMIKMLVAKRVEYIEKDIQVEEWRIRMGRWSYDRLGTFLAIIAIPRLCYLAVLLSVSLIWVLGMAALWPFWMPVEKGWDKAISDAIFVTLIPFFGLFLVAASIISGLFLPVLRAGLESLRTLIWRMAAQPILIPAALSVEWNFRIFFLSPFLLAVIWFFVRWSTGGTWYDSILESPLLEANVLPFLLFFWLPMWRFIAEPVRARIDEMGELSNRNWNTEPGFLRQIVDTSHWQGFYTLELHRVLGEQVERAFEKINELKTRMKGDFRG